MRMLQTKYNILDIINNNEYELLNDIIESYYEFIDRKFPPVEIEKFFKISNISNIYKLPFNLDEKHLEALSYNYMKNEVITNFIFYELIKKNKELSIFKNVEYLKNGHFKKCSIIGGVCSRMNIDDISDFITEETEINQVPKNDIVYTFYRSSEIDLYEELYNKVYNYGIYISYFPSIKTLNLIIDSIH